MIRGVLKVEVFHAGQEKPFLVSRQANLITDVGLDHMRDLLAGDIFFMTHMAVGTGVTLPSVSDTVLETEVFRNLIARRVPTAENLRMQMFIGTGDANGNTLAEAGIFNAASGGTMFSRVLLAPTIVKTGAISVTLTWDYTFMEGTP